MHVYFCSLLYNNEALTSKFAKTNNLLCEGLAYLAWGIGSLRVYRNKHFIIWALLLYRNYLWWCFWRLSGLFPVGALQILWLILLPFKVFIAKVGPADESSHYKYDGQKVYCRCTVNFLVKRFRLNTKKKHGPRGTLCSSYTVHVVNAVQWYPSEQTHMSHTNKQINVLLYPCLPMHARLR